jgi:hypothetical protein
MTGRVSLSSLLSTDGTPEGLRSWIQTFGATAFPVAEGALPQAIRNALNKALSLPPERREAAWALLAADALLTWGVEAAASAQDPALAIEAVLELVVERAQEVTD